MTKQQWISLFEEIGLDKRQMNEWHQRFEKRFPEDHEAFLQWLNIPEGEIRQIRSEAAAEA